MNTKINPITEGNLPLALNVAQLAQILCIGKGSAYRLVQSGAIRSIRIGRQIRVPKVELLRYLGELDR